MKISDQCKNSFYYLPLFVFIGLSRMVLLFIGRLLKSNCAIKRDSLLKIKLSFFLNFCVDIRYLTDLCYYTVVPILGFQKFFLAQNELSNIFRGAAKTHLDSYGFESVYTRIGKWINWQNSVSIKQNCILKSPTQSYIGKLPCRKPFFRFSPLYIYMYIKA